MVWVFVLSHEKVRGKDRDRRGLISIIVRLIMFSVGKERYEPIPPLAVARLTFIAESILENLSI